MLGKQGILEQADVAAIEKGLAAVEAEIEAGSFTFSRALEDPWHLLVRLNTRWFTQLGEPASQNGVSSFALQKSSYVGCRTVP